MKSWPACLVLLLGSCAGPVAPVLAPSASPVPRSHPEGSATAASESTTDPTPLPALATLLPAEIDGVEAHTFAVADDLVARLAAAIGVAVTDLDVAYASAHGARFIQMIAIRTQDVSAERLLEALPEVAYPPVGVGEVEVATDVLAGRDVVRVHHPGLAARMGAFYGFNAGAALIVVEAFERDVAEAAIRDVP